MEKQGQKCVVNIPDPKYRDDVLHPCIRYVEEGYCGHHWWMVMSPFYGQDDTIENPILFYGDAELDGTPPLTWRFAEVVKDTPSSGYNSDPCLCFDQGSLWVVWREFRTDRVLKAGYNTAIYGVRYDASFQRQEEIFLGGESSNTELTDLSPIILKVDKKWVSHTMYVHLENSLFRRGRIKLARFLGKRGSAHTALGLRVKKADNLQDLKKADASLKSLQGNLIGLLPWHFDLFFYQDRMFMLLFCQGEGNIYLAEYKAGRFVVFDDPLLEQEVVSMYKPTGVVMGEKLYLYYTDRNNPEDTKQHVLYRYFINISDYLETHK